MRAERSDRGGSGATALPAQMRADRRAERRMHLTSPPWKKRQKTPSKTSWPNRISFRAALVALLLAGDHAAKRRRGRDATAPQAVLADFDRADDHEESV